MVGTSEDKDNPGGTWKTEAVPLSPSSPAPPPQPLRSTPLQSAPPALGLGRGLDLLRRLRFGRRRRRREDSSRRYHRYTEG